MKGEKFPQAEYAEFMGDGVYFDEKPPKPVSEDEKKETDNIEVDTSRSYIVSPDGSIAPPQITTEPVRKQKKERMLPARISNAETGVPPYSEKKTDAAAIPTDTISKEGVRADSNSSTPPAPKVRIGRESHDVGIQRRKEEYINDYTRNVKNMMGIERVWGRFRNWIGSKNKHNYSRDWKTNESEKEFNKRQDMSVAERLAEVQAEYKTRARNERIGSDGKSIDREKAFKKYQEIMKKIEAARERAHVSGKALEKVKEDREALNNAREAAWEKSKFMKQVSSVFSAIGTNPAWRKTMGNRYVRAVAIGGLAGLATGGLTSSAFWLTRLARFGAGAIAGRETKKLLDKKLNEEEILVDRLATLDKKFQNKEIARSEYDTQRLSIDMEIQGIRRLKDLLTASAGAAAGMGAGAAVDATGDFIHDRANSPVSSVSEEGRIETPPTPIPDTSPEPVPIQDPEAILPPQYTYPDAMPVSSLGALDTIEKYKAQLAAFYVDKPIPPVAQHFMDTPTADLAKEIGAWDPNAVNESHTMPKGSTIGLKDGALLYHNSVTGADTEVLKTLGSRAGEVVVPTSNELDMFDSGKTVVSPEVTVVDQPLASEQSDAQLSGGRGAPNENIREVVDDKPLESRWFTVADENTVATPASATPSIQGIETPPGDAPEIPAEEQEALARKAEEASRKALYEEVMKEETEVQNVPETTVAESNTTAGGMANAETLPLKEVEPQSIPLVDESELKVQNQTNVPNEEFSSSETVDTVDESTNNETVAPAKTTPELPAAITEGPFKDSSLDFAFNEKTGQYDLRSMFMVTPEVVRQAIPDPESYLVNGNGTVLSGLAQERGSYLERYRFLDGLLRFGGFEPGSPYHDAIVRAAQNLQEKFENDYAGGADVLKDITPKPVR